MADVSIKIQLQDTIEDVIGGVSANKATNNVSSIVSKNTKKNDGTPLLSFASGYIKFDVDGNLVNSDGVAGKAILEGTYNGFVFGATDANGEYSVTLTITGSHIDSLIFYGDKLANQFPIEAYLDGDNTNKIYSNDSIWAIVFDTSTTSHTVTFTKWNRANYNACFTHIAVLRNELWLDKAWIKNVESVSQSTGQPNEIFYGIIANSGSAEILDRNGELLDYITDGIIENSNLPVSIWANGKQVQAHITNNSDYDTNSITLSFEMTNEFENWDNINYDGYLFSTTSTTAYDMLVSVLNSIGYQNDYSNNYMGQLIDEMLENKIVIGNLIDDNTAEMSIKSYLQSITIPYPCLKSDTIRNIIEKFCILAQLQVYKDDNNKIKFISARPCITTNDLTKVLIIPVKHENSRFLETKILKNKYNGVEINKKIITKEENSNIYSSNPIYCCEDRIFVGNDEGKNDETYDVFGGTFDTTNWFQFNFSIDLEKLNKERNLPINLDELKIETILNRKNYTRKNGEYTLDVKADTSNNILLKYSAIELKYHMYNSARIDGQFVANNLYSAKIENNILYIRCQVEWATDIGSAELEDVSYNIAFIQDFTFNILKPTYSIEDNNLKTGDNVIKINDCILIQENTLFNNNYYISNLISNNIKNDYNGGIADATVTVTCSNYYDINGNLTKDWSKGEIIQVGDIVRIDKDNEGNSASYYKDGTPRLWRVTGRTFKKQGVPLIDLELQEIISPIPIAYEMTQTLKDCSIYINRISSVVENVDLGIIDINTPIYYGDVIKITATPSTNKEIVTFKINSSDYLNNTEYTISGNINIECLCYGWEQVSDFESISIDTESGDTNIDINEQYSATISGIIADKDIRVWGYSEFYSVDGYYFNTNEGLFQGQGNLDYPNDTLGTINIYDVPQDPSSGGGGGAILGYIYISIKKPIENNKFIYTNYTTVGKNNAYLSKFIFTKIEQYL